MSTTKVIINKAFRVGRIDSRLFGSFLEHMGRVIYTGIYEPETIIRMRTVLERMFLSVSEK